MTLARRAPVWYCFYVTIERNQNTGPSTGHEPVKEHYPVTGIDHVPHKMTKQQIVTTAAHILSTMENPTGTQRKIGEKTNGILTFGSGDNAFELTTGEFGDIYRAMVGCWPVVKPLNDSLVTIQREEGKVDREKAAAEAKVKREADRAKAKADMALDRQAKAAAKAQVKAEEALKAAQARAEAAKIKATADAEAAAQEKAKKAEQLKALAAAADRLATTGSAKLPDAELKKSKAAKK